MDIVKSVWGTYQLAKLRFLLLSYPSCQRNGCNSSGLSDGDDTLSSNATLIQVLGDLSGLSGAGLTWYARVIVRA